MLLLWWWGCGTASHDPARLGPVSEVRRVVARANSASTTDEQGAVVVAAAGDIMPHRAVEEAAADFAARRGVSAREGYDAVFEGIRPLVEDADIAFANLETPVSPSRFRPRRPRVFNADPLLVESLVATGFDLVSLANNHAFDQGPEGLEETMAVLAERSLGYVGVGSTCGAARGPVFVQRNGLLVAFLAATELLNEDWNLRDDTTCTATLEVAQVLPRVREAREAGADFVVLSLHWGEEYERDPGPRRRRVAGQLVDGGVDVILGHHAHVLQPVELRPTADGRTALVVYGLGNLVSNQAAWYRPGVHRPRSAAPRDGVWLSFRLSKRRVGTGLEATIRREIVDIRAVPLWTVNNQPIRTRATGTEIRVMPTWDVVGELVASSTTEEEPPVASSRSWVRELRERATRVERDVTPELIPAPSDAR